MQLPDGDLFVMIVIHDACSFTQKVMGVEQRLPPKAFAAASVRLWAPKLIFGCDASVTDLVWP